MTGSEVRKERKTVTVLFADLVGFTSRAETLDPEDVEAILEPYHARLRAEIERFAGTVEKFIGDAVMALFGAPVTHEDDPERAVRAAFAIRDWAVAEGVEVRVAVNTGEALVRVGAHPETGEGMAAGDVVNTAARLQTAAPVNGILVGQATYRATRQVIDFREAEPVTAKGKAEPIAVWEAVRPRGPIGHEISRPHATPLVSREQELDALKSALARACEGRSAQFVTLVGVPGIGKSRLVHELAHFGEEQGLTWLRGRSLPYGAGVSFWALVEMVKMQTGILDSDPPDVAEQKLSQAVAAIVTDERDLPWIERHLQPLVGLGGDGPTSGDRRAESFAAWRHFLAAVAAERPLVLVFEDLHWADDDLLDFVESLTEWLIDISLLVLCTARPELLERRPGWSAGKPGALKLSIAPLGDSETAALIARLVERAILPAETVAALLARASGNPLYAEQYVRMLVERGDAEGVPESVQGIIATRLDALSPEEKDLIQSAAVIGQVFWPGALAAIIANDRWTVEERLHGLERKELVRTTASSVAGEPAYAFPHMLVRDVAYGQIPRGQRAEKHRLAAEWIESLGRPEDHAEMLAHHYSSALEYARAAGQSMDGLVERAREALCSAGDRSFALNAYAAAARSYAAARELWPEEDLERARLAFLLGRARFFAEEAGAEELAEASRLLEAAGDIETAAEAELLISDLNHRRAEAEASTAHLERARALVGDLPASPASAWVAGTTARRLMLAGDVEAAIAAAREALRLAEELGIDELRASALGTIGTSRVWSGDLGGVEDVEKSAGIAAEIGSGSELVRAKGNLMVFTISRGDVRRGADLALELMAIAERYGQAPALRWFRNVRLTPPYWRGDWDQGIRVADEFIAEVEGGATHYNAMQFYAYRGHIRLARGDVNAALEDAEKAVAVARLVTDTQQLPRALGLSAFAFAEAGAPDRAAPLVDEAIGLLASGIKMLLAVVGLPSLAEAARILGRSAELRDALGERFSWSLWADAARAIARDEFVQAAEICDTIGSLPDEALCRLRAAEQFVDQGRRREADEQLGRALAFYRSVGATRFIRRGERLLAL